MCLSLDTRPSTRERGSGTFRITDLICAVSKVMNMAHIATVYSVVSIMSLQNLTSGFHTTLYLWDVKNKFVMRNFVPDPLSLSC